MNETRVEQRHSSNYPERPRNRPHLPQPGHRPCAASGSIGKRGCQKKAPRVVLCTDESVAVSAAHGYAMVSGKPQVVAVFEDVGTLQGGGAIVNLKYGRIPVILCAGANSTPGRMNWRHEAADQGRIGRGLREMGPRSDSR